MDTKLQCFCGSSINLNEFSAHYRKCWEFKSTFKDLDKSIASSIKRYVDKCNSTEDYLNKLYLLGFFLMRYVNLVHELIKKKDKYDKFIPALQGIDITSKFNMVERTQYYDFAQIKNLKEINKAERGLIYNYCKNLYDKNPNFDNKSSLKAMELTISDITSRECFVMVAQNNSLYFYEGDDKIFQKFKYKDTDFYILLY